MPKPANDDHAPILRSMSEDRLVSYVEDRLSPDERRDVEGYLACNPDLAARVMAAFHRRERRPSRRRRYSWMMALVASLMMSGATYAAMSLGKDSPPRGRSATWRELDGDAAPAYVEEAAMSELAVVARLSMLSQPESPALDEAEIGRALNLALPPLPEAWRVIDVQVFPSDDGPGLNVAVEAAGRRLNLFAVRVDTEVTRTPVVAQLGNKAAIYWERRDNAFILSGDAEQAALLEIANLLAQGEGDAKTPGT